MLAKGFAVNGCSTILVATNEEGLAEAKLDPKMLWRALMLSQFFFTYVKDYDSEILSTDSFHHKIIGNLSSQAGVKSIITEALSKPQT